MVDKVRLMLRTDGFGGTLSRVARRAASYVALSESHLWFVLDLQAERPRPPLAPELTLVRAKDSDRQLLEQLPTLAPSTAAARIAAGNGLWLVLDGDKLLFNIWAFRGHTPAIAAPGDQLPMPPDVVGFEYAESLPAARGRGIAPAAYAAIGDALAAEGTRWIITKIVPDNEIAQRSAEKVGFRAAAAMHFKRRGPWAHAWLEPLDDGPLAISFVEQLGPGLFDGRASS